MNGSIIDQRAIGLCLGAGQRVQVTGAGFGRDSFIGGAGISTTLAGFGVTDRASRRPQLFVDYDVKTTGSYLANVVSGGLRVKF